jgi:hypothetical protein
MKDNVYNVSGDRANGYRICIPIKALTADKYKFIGINEKTGLGMLMPKGTLVYIPVKE